jgi:hypothetical protein
MGFQSENLILFDEVYAHTFALQFLCSYSAFEALVITHAHVVGR